MLVTLIIPMYNAQKYIIKCLESVVNQTYSDYEVIIVNDGSTDESQKLVSDFIEKNSLSNFFLINKENGGVSSARNTAIDRASGEWIMFLDSDDWIEPNLLSDMIEYDKKYHADYYLSGVRAYESTEQRFDVWSNYSVVYGVMPDNLKDLSLCDYIWGRFYKKSIIDNSSIRFDERISFCEDNAFNFDYMSAIQSFVCINRIGYTYRRGHPGAATKGAVNPYMRKYVWEHMHSFCKNMPLEDLNVALKENISFLRIMWNAVLTETVIKILENDIVQAQEIMHQPISCLIIDAYKPKNKKDKLLLFLWTRPFFLFKLIVIIFYKNINHIKKIKWLSRFLTH